MCSGVCAEIGEMIIFRTMELLETYKKPTNRELLKMNQAGVQEFFKDKMKQLELWQRKAFCCYLD